MIFKKWLLVRENEENYIPIITQNSVLFPVFHNIKVISSKQARKKMRELASFGTTIWHEGQSMEPVVEQFIEDQSKEIPELSNLPTKSWETKNPQIINKSRFKQGLMLNSIFGGSNEAELAQNILLHPFVQTLNQPTVLEALEAASKSPKSRIPDTGPEAFIKGKWQSFPQGWNVYSDNPLRKRQIEALVQLANEPNMQVFKNLLYKPATQENLVKFLKIGRYQGYNKPTFNPSAPLSSLGKLQKDVNYERDLFLLQLMREGGIFFAGADHIPNITKLISK